MLWSHPSGKKEKREKPPLGVSLTAWFQRPDVRVGTALWILASNAHSCGVPSLASALIGWMSQDAAQVTAVLACPTLVLVVCFWSHVAVESQAFLHAIGHNEPESDWLWWLISSLLTKRWARLLESNVTVSVLSLIHFYEFTIMWCDYTTRLQWDAFVRHIEFRKAILIDFTTSLFLKLWGSDAESTGQV